MKKANRRNTTTVTTDTATVTATTQPTAARKKGTGTARQQKRAQLLKRIRLAYWALTPQARNGFRNLCRLMPQNQVITKTGTRQKVTTFFLFSALNQAVSYSGAADSVTVPPATPGYAPPFPGSLRLVSSYDTQGKWSLRLSGGTYSASVAVALAPSAMQGANYGANAYLQAGPLATGIPSGGADLTALFLSVYPAAPLAGEQVGAQITGVTTQGFATAKLSLLAVTASVSAEADSDDAQTLRAA